MPNLSFFPNLGCIFNSSLCAFDSSLTLAGVLLILVAILGMAVCYKLLQESGKNPITHLSILTLGVLLFESFTAPMWNSAHLGFFTYIYNDMSLVLTFGWVVIFQLSISLVDWMFPKLNQLQRFMMYLIPITLVTVIAENVLVLVGVRSYAPEIWQTSIASLGLIPVEVLYYAPTFAALVLSFYFAWTRTKGDSLRQAFTKNAGLTAAILTVGIVMYELLIEPMVIVSGFPEWSYFYQDISFIRIALWVLMIFAGMWVGSLLIGKSKKVSQLKVATTYLFSSSLVFYIVEYILLANKDRVYTSDVVSNFTGLVVPVFNTPIEVVLAICMYLALIISFLKYWRYIFLKK